MSVGWTYHVAVSARVGERHRLPRPRIYLSSSLPLALFYGPMIGDGMGEKVELLGLGEHSMLSHGGGGGKYIGFRLLPRRIPSLIKRRMHYRLWGRRPYVVATKGNPSIELYDRKEFTNPSASEGGKKSIAYKTLPMGPLITC